MLIQAVGFAVAGGQVAFEVRQPSQADASIERSVQTLAAAGEDVGEATLGSKVLRLVCPAVPCEVDQRRQWAHQRNNLELRVMVSGSLGLGGVVRQ